MIWTRYAIITSLFLLVCIGIHLMVFFYLPAKNIGLEYASVSVIGVLLLLFCILTIPVFTFFRKFISYVIILSGLVLLTMTWIFIIPYNSNPTCRYALEKHQDYIILGNDICEFDESIKTWFPIFDYVLPANMTASAPQCTVTLLCPSSCPLIPGFWDIMEYYDIEYIKSSLIYITSVYGFLVSLILTTTFTFSVIETRVLLQTNCGSEPCLPMY